MPTISRPWSAVWLEGSAVARRVGVLLVDDSATVRAVLRRLLRAAGDIEIAGEAGNGRDAVEATIGNHPDVVLMDIEMPEMNGLAAIEQIMALCPTPIIVLSSRVARDQMQTAFAAIRMGAVEVLAKPEDPPGWNELARTLPQTVRSVAGARTGTALKLSQLSAATAPRVAARALRHIAIGASTGGPQAIHALLASLPPRIGASVIIVQHIAAGFEAALADWLAADLKRDIRPAQDGDVAAPGVIRVAPSGSHLLLGPGNVLHLDDTTPPRGGHKPSVDLLFMSCAEVAPREVAGVLLSGMGHDGAEGLAVLRRAGGLTIVQDEPSSVVFGMPQSALDRGAAELALAPPEIGKLLARQVSEVMT